MKLYHKFLIVVVLSLVLSYSHFFLAASLETWATTMGSFVSLFRGVGWIMIIISAITAFLALIAYSENV